MKYYLDPTYENCIISLAKSLKAEEGIVPSLHNNKKIDRAAFGIKLNKDKKSGTLYLGGLPDEEKEGLNSYEYKFSFFNKITMNDKWYLPINFAAVKTKTNEFDIRLTYDGNIDFGTDYIFVPPKFYTFLINNIIGNYITEKSCDYENGILICECKDIKKLKHLKIFTFLLMI